MGVWLKVMMSKDHIRDLIASSLQRYFDYAKTEMPLNWDFESSEDIPEEKAEEEIIPIVKESSENAGSQPQLFDRSILVDNEIHDGKNDENELISEMLRFLEDEEDAT